MKFFTHILLILALGGSSLLPAQNHTKVNQLIHGGEAQSEDELLFSAETSLNSEGNELVFSLEWPMNPEEDEDREAGAEYIDLWLDVSSPNDELPHTYIDYGGIRYWVDGTANLNLFAEEIRNPTLGDWSFGHSRLDQFPDHLRERLPEMEFPGQNWQEEEAMTMNKIMPAEFLNRIRMQLYPETGKWTAWYSIDQCPWIDPAFETQQTEELFESEHENWPLLSSSYHQLSFSQADSLNRIELRIAPEAIRWMPIWGMEKIDWRVDFKKNLPGKSYDPPTIFSNQPKFVPYHQEEWPRAKLVQKLPIPTALSFPVETLPRSEELEFILPDYLRFDGEKWIFLNREVYNLASGARYHSYETRFAEIYLEETQPILADTQLGKARISSLFFSGATSEGNAFGTSEWEGEIYDPIPRRTLYFANGHHVLDGEVLEVFAFPDGSPGLITRNSFYLYGEEGGGGMCGMAMQQSAEIHYFGKDSLKSFSLLDWATCWNNGSLAGKDFSEEDDWVEWVLFSEEANEGFHWLKKGKSFEVRREGKPIFTANWHRKKREWLIDWQTDLPKEEE